jgi:hypothetical protein
MSSLRAQAAVLHCFSRVAREQGTIFCAPEEIRSWFGDVLSKELDEPITSRLLQEVFTDLERSRHLVRTEQFDVVAWSLPNAVGPNCICGCNCSSSIQRGRPLCWPCYIDSKNKGPAGHIFERLKMEANVNEEAVGL